MLDDKVVHRCVAPPAGVAVDVHGLHPPVPDEKMLGPRAHVVVLRHQLRVLTQVILRPAGPRTSRRLFGST